MRRLNPDWTAAMRGAVNTCPYFELQSMELTKLSPGSARLEIELQPKHMQPFGIVHGGVFAGLIDAAGFWAAYTRADEDSGLSTVEMKLNFLSPSEARGRLMGQGRCIKLGRTLGLAEARIEDQDGRLMAHGVVTLMVLPRLKVSGGADFPPKFAD